MSERPAFHSPLARDLPRWCPMDDHDWPLLTDEDRRGIARIRRQIDQEFGVVDDEPRRPSTRRRRWVAVATAGAAICGFLILRFGVTRESPVLIHTAEPAPPPPLASRETPPTGHVELPRVEASAVVPEPPSFSGAGSPRPSRGGVHAARPPRSSADVNRRTTMCKPEQWSCLAPSWREIGSAGHSAGRSP